ncbi:MAG: molybdopterin cofactor-binding domain-containing protein [Pseudomonadota bacterium]
MKKRGRGIACVQYQAHAPIPNPSGAVIDVLHDGTVNLAVGSADIGQGSNTILAQIAAEELGVPLESISVRSADTETTPYCVGTYGTRVTYVCGNAVRKAASEAKEILLSTGAELLQTDADRLEIRNGMICVRDEPEKAMAVADAAGYSIFMKGKPLLTSATYSPHVIPIDPETGQGEPAAAYSFGAQMAEVEVDTETGEVTVLKVIAAHDVGKAINPGFVENQIEGGIQMGLGYALMEEVKVDRTGVILTPDFTDYLIPTSLDVPDIEVLCVETNEPTGPFGAKGIGEAVTCPTAPAIINAVYDAVGVWIRNLPATPEKVLAALKQGQDKGMKDESISLRGCDA